MREKKHRYSEIFGETFQGEGLGGSNGGGIGTNTVWVRWWGCNLSCIGFGQDKENPISKKDMYYEKLDPISIKTIDDFPTQDIGCDSMYAHHPKFKHLATKATAKEISEKLVDANRNIYNPKGLFVHPRSGQDIHLCFTGGESMMSQDGISEVLQYLKDSGNYPLNVTIETNGTVKLSDDFKIPKGINLFWSCSPKIESVSGEKSKKAICPDVLDSYNKYNSEGQLKFVCNNTTESWEEIELAIDAYRATGVKWNVCIMPEGASADAQSRHDAEIAEESIRRGYYFTARVHAIVFGAVAGK